LARRSSGIRFHRPVEIDSGLSVNTEIRGINMLNRRDFLKGMGAAAAAGAALPTLTGVPEAEAGPGEPEVLGPAEVEVTLRVNGKKQTLRVEPRVTLLDALRDRLGITGPKKGCDRGACGACTVLRDGEPINACMTLAIENQDADIVTIEGIGTPEAPHPVQAAFAAHDALQCGFCTSGMVTSVYACLKKTPDASVKEIKNAVAGNLCRCGTYPRVFAAALAAKKGGKAWRR
jgi:aerobic-type carbon monoxide dehydrogenase small subunit (CoxS/CutS family)